MTEEIGGLVLRRASTPEVKELAVSQGMHTLRDDGLRKVARGDTTFEELFRVVS